MRQFITLEQFIVEQEKGFAHATGELSALLRDIGLAARIINREVNRAGLVDILGLTGAENTHGESVTRLDEFANRYFKRVLSYGGLVAGMASEEDEDIIVFSHGSGKYVILIDPLDGSSNIDVNVSIGTIFSIYQVLEPIEEDVENSEYTTGKVNISLQDFLQAGRKQIAAGYVIYGTSTMLVYTTGQGVNGFTLDPSIGEFILSHPNITIPTRAAYYSMNESAYHDLHPGLRKYVNHVKQRQMHKSDELKPRYAGSLVADFHRNLLKGGIFLYPGTNSKPEGKLRLLYEGNPIGFIAEQAGGQATNGKKNLLDIVPKTLHQRTPIFVGNATEVELIHSYLQEPTF